MQESFFPGNKSLFAENLLLAKKTPSQTYRVDHSSIISLEPMGHQIFLRLFVMVKEESTLVMRSISALNSGFLQGLAFVCLFDSVELPNCLSIIGGFSLSTNFVPNLSALQKIIFELISYQYRDK